MVVSQFLRIITICMAVGLVGMTLAITWTYRVSHRRDPDCGPRFLPLHVATIGLSYSAFALVCVAEMVGRFEDPATWRLPLYLFATVTGDVAQAAMFNVVFTQLQVRGRRPKGG